jgi:iron complex outermembrane receptor protein
MVDKRHLVFSCALSALLFGAGFAHAADDSPPSVKGVAVEEVIVTAQKHDSKLQSSPVAVTQYSAEIRNLTATNTTAQLVNLTPGVFLNDYGLNIRGIGRGEPTTTLGSTNGVALYVNGFYNIDPGVIGESTLFGGNVQFLRGPQGTLYGRDAIGGAANLISRRPTKTFQGEAVAAYGQYNASNLGITLAGPLNDRYGMRVGLQSFDTPQTAGKSHGTVGAGFTLSNIYAEIQLEGQVTDKLHFLLRSTHFEYENTPGYTLPDRYASTPSSPLFTGLTPNPQFDPTGGAAPLVAPQQAFASNEDFRGRDRLTGNQVHILNADYNLGAATLFYVGGYAGYRSFGNSDYDNTPRSSFSYGAPISSFQTANYDNHNHYYSHELRLSGNDATVFDWTLGLYYLESQNDERYWQALPNVPQVATPAQSAALGAPFAAANPDFAFYSQRNLEHDTSKAVFGSMTYQIDPAWSVTGGLRFTEDEKHATTNFRYVAYNPYNPYVIYGGTGGSPAVDVTPALHSVSPSLRNDGTTARLDVVYKPTPATVAWAGYALGYKAGGFTLGNVVSGNVTKPEHLNDFEVGLKQTFSPAIRIDATAFYYDYHDYQLPLSFVDPVTHAVTPLYTNVPKAQIYGLELQGVWTPISAVSLTANYTYLHAKTTSTILGDDYIADNGGAVTPQNLSGRDLPRTPHNKANVLGYYRIDVAPGSIYLGGSVSYTGAAYENAFQDQAYKIPGYTLTNLSVTFRTSDNRYEVVAAGTNVFNVRYDASLFYGGTNIGPGAHGIKYARYDVLGAPEFFNMTFRARF